jgi:sulfate permease, SulP family
VSLVFRNRSATSLVWKGPSWGSRSRLSRLVSNRIPGAIVALLVGTAAVVVFKLPVETIGSRFGGIPSGLSHFAMPRFRVELIHGLLGPAVTIAMLGAIESLMSAMVSDGMSDDRHNSNVELIGQGVANIVSPLFGGLPATGAIARTATNIRAGAQSPVAGMIHALTLLCILLFAAPLVSLVPMSVLARILMVVSYNMGEWREIPQLLKLTKTDISVWLVTFTLTVFADLTVAVEAGMILAALLFIGLPASQIRRTRPIAARCAASEVKSGVGSKHRNQDRERNQAVVVITDHRRHRSSLRTPF